MPKGNLGKLITVFNRYIRLRDTDERGYGTCISCGTTKHFSELDAGHYWSVKSSPIRFDERNVNAQCLKCNRFKEGNKPAYTIGLIQKYGYEIIDTLDQERRKAPSNSYWSQPWLKEKIKEYQDKVKQLEGKLPS